MNIPTSLNLRALPNVTDLILAQKREASNEAPNNSLETVSVSPTRCADSNTDFAPRPCLRSSFHVGAHKAHIRLLRLLSDESLPQGLDREGLSSLFSGAGVYIGPEDRGLRGGHTPHPASDVAMIRDELLRLTRSEFPKADQLYVLGPHYEFGYCETPSPACDERGFFYGLDQGWPRELIERKLSWGICLGLWDSAYYMTQRDDMLTLAQKYEETAAALYSNMADRAALLVSTLMWNSVDSLIFDRSFRNAGWELTRVGSHGAEPLLMIKR